MSFDVEGAKKAGYTDQEIKTFLSKPSATPISPSFDVEAAKKVGYTDDEIKKFINEKGLSKTRSIISAPAKGLLKGLSEIAGQADPTQIILNTLSKNTPAKQFEQVTEQVLPTRKEEAEQYLERAGKIAPYTAFPGTTIPLAIAQTVGGTLLGQLAKEEGAGELGQGVAETVGMGLPGLAKAGVKGVVAAIKAPTETMVSGLTKPQAIGAKLAGKAIVTPESQDKAIAKLHEEAAALTKNVVKKELPLADPIEQGFDFETQFKNDFGQVQKTAEAANPHIDVTPISNFMRETASKYKGIPKPHPEAVKIKSEIKAYSKGPQTELGRLLRIYRSNHKKISGIYETSRLMGKQKEYVDFLLDYNRNIANSIENTLPKDSAWVKMFKDANKTYKQFKDTQQTLTTLEPILNQKLTTSSLKKFSSDKRMQNKLALSMGQQGASEVVQIASDLETAESAIKNMAAKKYNLWDAAFPLAAFIPGIHVPGAIAGAKKYADWARRGYGWYLSSPARRTDYSKALKAIKEGNLSLYEKATKELKKSTESEE